MNDYLVVTAMTTTAPLPRQVRTLHYASCVHATQRILIRLDPDQSEATLADPRSLGCRRCPTCLPPIALTVASAQPGPLEPSVAAQIHADYLEAITHGATPCHWASTVHPAFPREQQRMAQGRRGTEPRPSARRDGRAAAL